MIIVLVIACIVLVALTAGIVVGVLGTRKHSGVGVAHSPAPTPGPR